LQAIRTLSGPTERCSRRLGSLTRSTVNFAKIEPLPPFDLTNLVVVLVRARNPLNIGAAARAMSNFGCRTLRLVNPYKLAFRDARSAVGGAGVLQTAVEFDSVPEAVSDCIQVIGTTAVGSRSLKQSLHVLNEQSGSEIRTQLQTGRVALLFGSEKTGLSNTEFSYCHRLLTIPTSDESISMNLGQAVAVCLYELARDVVSRQTTGDVEPAPVADLEMITELLMDSLRLSGYVKPGTNDLFEKKARQLLLRLNFQAYDAKLLLGMVRQILWKLRQPSKI
jgi:TrmH family RNA methyltransferase